jgi:hypothetical protein
MTKTRVYVHTCWSGLKKGDRALLEEQRDVSTFLRFSLLWNMHALLTLQIVLTFLTFLT